MSRVPGCVVGQWWAACRFQDARDLPPGCEPEVAVLETSGAVHLTPSACRQLAALLTAYAEDSGGQRSP